MYDPWKNRKVHCIGKYNIYSISGRESGNEHPRKWYTEIHAYTRHGLLYRASYGSNAPTRLLAVWVPLVRYKWLGGDKTNHE